MKAFTSDSRFSSRVRDGVRKQLRPENLPPAFSDSMTEYVALNMPPITSGQVVGAFRYDRQLHVDPTELPVTNTTDPTVIYTRPIAANLLGIQGAVELNLRGTFENNTGAARGLTLAVSYGGTTLFQGATGAVVASAAAVRPWRIVLELHAAGATDAQGLAGFFFLTVNAGAPTTGYGRIASVDDISGIFGGTSTVDSTLTKDLEVEITQGNADTEFVRTFAFLTKIAH